MTSSSVFSGSDGLALDSAAQQRRLQAQSPGEHRRQVRLHDRRIIAVLRLLASQGAVLAPPPLQQALMAARIRRWLRRDAKLPRGGRVHRQIQRLIAGEQEQDVQHVRRRARARCRPGSRPANAESGLR